MTQPNQITALLPLMADLSRDLSDADRYRRLLDGLRAILPCDAAALLRLEGDTLIPLAIDGLTPDALGRRFKLSEHPRFEYLLASAGPVRFPPDSPLPDPYDGLVDGVHGHLPVHDCMGCALVIEGQRWGLLTLDALQTDTFSKVEMDLLQAFASLASASVAVASRIRVLATEAEEAREQARSALQLNHPPRRQLIGHSAAHRAVVREIELAGPSDLSVLIQGETGVGKELVAKALHAASLRAKKPMISLNCAALPDNLVESELFGHVRGAFTGATADRRGKFELADGGTLFLDEVGELPLAAQAKLLRALQDGQVQRLGSDREHRVDVRVIAASNRNLPEEVRAGRVRADFYHRLSVYPLHVPPLRERGKDVLTLAGFFLEETRSRSGGSSVRLDAAAQAALLSYHWPGNVRELKHVLGRALIKARARQTDRNRIITIGADELALTTGTPANDLHTEAAITPDVPSAGLAEARADYERSLIRTALEQGQHSWAAAARLLKMDRANLVRLAKRLGVA